MAPRFGALGDFLAAIVNPNMGGGNHVGNLVEDQVLAWCKQIVGLPPESSGLLVSGGSMANLVAPGRGPRCRCSRRRAHRRRGGPAAADS